MRAAADHDVGVAAAQNLRRLTDRAAAVRLAIRGAIPGDTVLLAGKGHERSILTAAGSVPWNERAAAEVAIRERTEA